RRAGGAPAGPRRGRLQRGAAGTGVGREHRPVHHHGAGDGQDVAPQARRPAAGRDGGGRGLPDPPGHAMTVYRPRRQRLRPTLRLRLTLLNGVLLVGVGTLMITLAWLLLSDAVLLTDQL